MNYVCVCLHCSQLSQRMPVYTRTGTDRALRGRVLICLEAEAAGRTAARLCSAFAWGPAACCSRTLAADLYRSAHAFLLGFPPELYPYYTKDAQTFPSSWVYAEGKKLPLQQWRPP